MGSSRSIAMRHVIRPRAYDQRSQSRQRQRQCQAKELQHQHQHQHQTSTSTSSLACLKVVSVGCSCRRQRPNGLSALPLWPLGKHQAGVGDPEAAGQPSAEEGRRHARCVLCLCWGRAKTPKSPKSLSTPRLLAFCRAISLSALLASTPTNQTSHPRTARSFHSPRPRPCLPSPRPRHHH